MLPRNRSWLLTRLLLLVVFASLFLTACSRALNNGSWPGLSVDGDLVYVARGTDVRAVNIADRQEIWKYPAEPRAQLNFFARPALDGDQIFLGDYGASGGFFSPAVIVSVYALNNGGAGAPSDGWTNADVASDRIIAAPAAADGRVYVPTADNFLFALDGQTGAEIWSFEAGHSFWAQPLVVDGVIYQSSMDHNVYALNSSDGTVLWQSQMNGAVPSAPTYVDGTLYVGTFGGVLHALDASSGEELWAYEADDWIWSTPSVVDDMILFADGSGNVYAISTSGGEELWRQQAKGAVQAAILVHDGVAYVGAVGLEDEAVGQILALDLSDGSIIWEKPTLAPIYADMVIAADALVVAESSEEALLVVYDLENGAEIWKYLPE